MSELMTELDTLLRASAGFLLGQWVRDARAFATNNSNSTGAAGKAYDADFLEWNARSQVTSWFPVGQESPGVPGVEDREQKEMAATGGPSGLKSGLWDYGNKAWGGLVDPYYSTRYQIYAAHKLQSISGKRTFNESAYDKDLVAWAHNFEHRKWDETTLPATATGDVVKLSRALWTKYAPAASRL
jgi:alpha-N-acetylglucosaminidase